MLKFGNSAATRRLVLFAVLAVMLAGLVAVVAAAGIDPTEVRPEPDADRIVNRQIPGSQSAAHVPAAQVPRPAPLAIASANGGFAGVTFHNQRRDADNGNQWSLEPPDQGLCVGNGHVIDAVNDAFAVYDTSGARQGGFESLNQFFTNDHAIIRPSGPYGTFLSDPKCYFDQDSGRFFFTILTIAIDPATNAYLPHTSEMIAVSKSGTPTTSPSDWYFTTIDTTNDGTNGTPSHPGCPCLGDQPLIGSDKYGFYVTTNEYSLFEDGFNGAQVYAVQKSALIAGTKPNIQRIEGAPLASDYGDGEPYSLQPATTPTPAQFDLDNNGTEYLLGALEFGKNVSNLDNRIAVWALTNTASLDSRRPAVAINDKVITSQVYGLPGAIVQPKGPTPQADALKEHEDLIDGGDDRMQVAVYANGRLWGAGDTTLKTPTGSSQVGVTYYVVDPSASGSAVDGTIVKQGYLSVEGGSVTRPSLGVTSSGKAVIGVSLIGAGFYPSAAYATLDDVAGHAPTTLNVVSAGAAPSDGFTGYRAYGGSGVARWGDYGAAAVDGDSLWVANEWIPGLVQGSDIANWGTYVTKVTP